MEYEKTNWKYWRFSDNPQKYTKEYLRDWRKKKKTYMRDKMREYRKRKTELFIIDTRIKMLGNPEDTFTQDDLLYIESIKIWNI